MTTGYVLVHGGNVSADTWNTVTNSEDYPLGENIGGKVWSKVVSCLESQHYNVCAPTLSNEYSHNLSDHVQEICQLITENDLEDIILVAHSYGGMIITGVADKMPDRVASLVYIDAALPDPGQSLFDLLILSGLDPNKVVDGTPMAYTEKIQFDPHRLKTIPKSYFLCLESDFIAITELVKKKINANKDEWSYVELPTSHLPMATMPERLCKELVEIGSKGLSFGTSRA